MRSAWDDREAAQHVDDLARCAYAFRLLGEEKALVPYSTSASVKVRQKNVFGEEEDVLYITSRSCDPSAIEAGDLRPARLQRLVRLTQLDRLPDARLVSELRSAMLDVSTPTLSPNVLLHTVVPHKVVLHAYPDAILAVVNTPDGLDRVREIYGDMAVVVPYARLGLPLARRCAEALASGAGDSAVGLVLAQNGLVSFGDTARVAYERMMDLVTRAEQFLDDRQAWLIPLPDATGPRRPLRQELTALRQAVSASAGFPVILSTQTDARCLSFARREDVVALSQQGPPAPNHALYTRRLPLLGRDVRAFQAAYERYFAAHATADVSLRMRDPAPRVILDPEFGMCAIGRTAGEALAVGEIYRHTMEIVLSATALDAYRPLLAHDVFEVEYSASGQADPAASGALPMFAGEVALVTGAASGIGKACVVSFLARGAAVVGLDINPAIVGMHDRPDFLGLCCDVTDEAALCQALETAVRAFGGLDMLVPNAGVFPPGCPIASLQTADWRRVMSVNLDANLVLMREAYPLLKAAPRNGRVVVMSSRNVPAPGPGAVAYSASKAALTQLARVAALEWGKDGIRVNILNPHAVFDTGIWTEEVLKARAAHYGLTVEEYKRNNVLRVEVSSHDVGELVAEMCGPLFAKSTGAQVPIDGGSNRVI